MGRKPNPIATEFFIRGRKLDDASNRYEQTCRFCNERFPKGRVDTLVQHIVKRCAAIPFHDRQRALLQSEATSHLSPGDIKAYDAKTQTGTLPLQTDPGLSALETLAEVSRHHLDYQTHNIAAGSLADQAPDTNEIHPPAQKKRRVRNRDHGRAFTVLPGADDAFTSSVVSPHFDNVTDADAQTLVAALYEEVQTAQEIDPTTEFLVQDDAGDISTEMRRDSGGKVVAASTALQLAASAASELMMPQAQETSAFEAAQDPGEDTSYDISSRLGVSAQHSMIDPQLHRGDGEPVTSVVTAGNDLQQIASRTPLSMEDGYIERTKPRARGKFSEMRRREVQNMRKLGACMRCRMLKKPCSDGTPCTQCMKIDSARLWKQPCIRTKLQDEVDIWACSLFTVKAFKTTFRLRELLYLDSTPGRIEVAACPETSIHLTFDGLRALKPLSEDFDPATLASEGIEDVTDVHCIATETEDLVAKIDHYARLHHPTVQGIAWEADPYMKITLVFAARIALDQPALLLLSVTELWLCTKVLCGDLPLQVAINTEEAATMQPVTLDAAATTSTPREGHTKTYELINAQILGAVERHAAALAKTILAELERRLIQRQQSHQPEVFMVSVILTACVERMCALFGTLGARGEHNGGHAAGYTEERLKGSEQEQRQQGVTDPVLRHLEDQLRLAAAGPVEPQDAGTVNVPSDWPLERPPAYYQQQGERFADILHMLLQMRDITPPTTVNELGIVVSSEGGRRAVISEWLESAQISDEQLAIAAREGGAMKYLGKLLGR